jgi:cystathionine gamma-synthase
MTGAEEWELGTMAARGGSAVPSVNAPKVQPIVQSAVYTFTDLAQVDRVLGGEEPGYFYGRFGLPNLTSLEQLLAELEGAEAGLVTGSGMAAITLALLSTLNAGDHLVAAEELYGGTTVLLRDVLPRYSIETTFVDPTDPAAVAAAITPHTRAVLVETLSNPTLRLPDLHALARTAHARGAIFMVDNTLATPVLCRPLEFGADVVIHSVTKYLAGHDDVIAGVVMGTTDFITRCRALGTLLGTSLGPFDAWLAERGIKTLALRMHRISSTTQTLAEHLAEQRDVTRVLYPGLRTHPQFALARELLPKGAAGILSFEIAGGLEGVTRFLSALEGIPLAASLGGTATMVTHPGKMSHRGVSREERERLGITDGLLRMAVGIEEPSDLIAALDRALRAVSRKR